jgi:hypothetical protein
MKKQQYVPPLLLFLAAYLKSHVRDIGFRNNHTPIFANPDQRLNRFRKTDNDTLRQTSKHLQD